MGELISFRTYTNRVEAELAKGLLGENGIKAIISADDAGGARPDLLWSKGGAKLLVKEEDREAAIQVLGE